MKKKLVILLILPVLLFAAFDDIDCENYSAGLGGIVTFSKGAEAIFANPAGMIKFAKKSPEVIAASNYSNFWGLSELSDLGIGAGYRSGFGTFALSYRNFGEPELYAENLLSFSYGKKIFKDISSGVRLAYGHIDQGNYGSMNTLMIDFGLLWQISESISTGFLWQNCNAAQLDYGYSKSEIQSPFSIGLHMTLARWADLYLDLQRYEDNKFRMRVGQKVALGDYFSLKTGISGIPNKFYMGLTANKFDFALTYSAAYHADLGMTNHVFVKYD